MLQQAQYQVMLLLLQWLPVRQLFRLRTMSKSVYCNPLQDHALSPLPALNKESWLLLLKIPHSEIEGQGQEREGSLCPHHFLAYSDYEQEGFPVPTYGKLQQKVVSRPSHIWPCHRPAMLSANGLLAFCVGGQTSKSDWNDASREWDTASRELRHVIVLNILTGDFKLLPPAVDWHHPDFFKGWEYKDHTTWFYRCSIDDADFCMESDHSNDDRYFILLAKPQRGRYWRWKSSGFQEGFQLYDSRREQWKVTMPIRKATPADLANLIKCNFLNLYCDNPFFSSYSEWPGKGFIYGYEVDKDRWLMTIVNDPIFPICSRGRLEGSAFHKQNNGILLVMLCEWNLNCNLIRVMRVSPTEEPHCSTLVHISSMPVNLYCRGKASIVVGSNIFCLSFFPQEGAATEKECPRKEEEEDKDTYIGWANRIIVYDICNSIWYPVLLPYQDFFYGCVAVLEPRKSMRLTN